MKLYTVYAALFLILITETTTASFLRNTSHEHDFESRELGTSTPCATLPSLSKSAPYGAKRQLFALCDQYFPDPSPLGDGRFLSYGSCTIHSNVQRQPSSIVGILRYSLEAAFSGASLMQSQYTVRLFDGDAYQIILAGVSISPLTQGPYIDAVATFSLDTVIIDQGLANAKLNDCSFSTYKKMVYSYDDFNQNDLVTLTFF
jgi:hypothetical protein